MSVVWIQGAPGSNEAIDAGCTCAVIDNHYGRGFLRDGKTVWLISADCELHGKQP